jgi:hypothetical protein
MSTRQPRSLSEELRKAILRENARPAEDRFRSMVEHGSINEKGEVLLKSPLTEPVSDRPQPSAKRSKG